MPFATPTVAGSTVSTGRAPTGRPVVIGSPAGNSKRDGRPFARPKFAAALLAIASIATPARADDADLAKADKCLSCHAVDQKLVGPAFRSVAARYANDADAEARLAKKIREGGTGAWGVVPMPRNDISAADAQRLAHWVLSQK